MSSLVRWLTAPAIELAAMVDDTAAVLRREQRYRDVPAVEPNAGLIAEALLDGTFGLLVQLLVGVPDSQQVRRGYNELLAMREFLERNGWYADPSGYHQPPPPLRAPQRSRREAIGVFGRLEYSELVFESEYEPHAGEPGRERWLSHADNGTATAYLLEHEGEDRPWLIGLHGYGMGQPAVTIRGMAADWAHEELGLNVLLPVLPLHGPRSSTVFSGGGILQPDYASLMHLFSQTVWDLRRMVDWVRRRSDAPIGLHGVSLGGYSVALASAFIDDLACVIAGIPAVDFASLARQNEPWAYQAYGGDLQTDWALINEVMYPVAPLSFAPRVPAEGRVIYAGVGDRITRPDHARALWRHWGRPRIEWMSSGHVMATLKPELRTLLREVAADRLFAAGEAPDDHETARRAS